MNESARSLCLITATDLASAMLPEVSTEIIGDGQIAVIAAQYGRGKTPLLTHMALEAACAVPLTPLGLSTCRSPIVVLDGETGPAAQMHYDSGSSWIRGSRRGIRLLTI